MSTGFSDRLKVLENKRREKVIPQIGYLSDDLKAVPTCPPSTVLAVRTGFLCRDCSYWSVLGFNTRLEDRDMNFVEDGSIWHDYSSSDKFTGIFANADYYLAAIVGYYYDWVWNRDYAATSEELRNAPWLMVGGKTEYATAAEAEAEIDALLNGGTDTDGRAPFFYKYFPIVAVILRNNGVVGQSGQIMPVDYVNLGRSYIMRDVRRGRNTITA